MSSLKQFLSVSAIFCAQSLAACGGSADSQPSSANGGSAGVSSGGHSAGVGPHSAGAAPAGGSAGSAGSRSVETGSAGAHSNSGPGSRKLSEIKTDAQALEVCNQIKNSINDADLKKMLAGSCAISGQTGAASQLGTCEELQAECAAHSPVPSTNDGSCSADDVPDCDTVTVDEYIACTRGSIGLAIEYLSAITCDTDLEGLDGPGTAADCAGPFARCPEFAAAYQ